MGLLSEHPSIVTVLGAGFLESGQAYMVMPFMPAGSLAEVVRRDGPMPWVEASKVAVKLAGALHAAHNAGVIHRDVKPANVLVSEYGEAKLADFGIARVSGGSETKSGVVTASLAYAPPEVVEGKRPTVRSDIYSLGATVYDLVAGHAPFQVGGETSVAALLQQILNDDPADLVSQGVPGPFAEVIVTAMAKNPDDRFETAALFGRRMRLAQDELGIRPTELMIAKIEPQVPAAKTDAEPEARTEAGTQVDDEPETETVGVTAESPVTVSVVPDDTDGLESEETRGVPEVVPHEEDSASPARGSRMLLYGGVAAAAVLATVVGAILASRGGGEADTADNALPESDAPTAEGDLAQYVVEGYLPPIVEDPLDPPPIGEGDAGTEDPLQLAVDHISARVSQCPKGMVRDLRDLDLRGVQWTSRDLRCTDFRGADLSGSWLWGSDLTGVDLTAVAFDAPQFQAAVLVDADLSGASFHPGDWGYADLTRANFAGLRCHPRLRRGGLRRNNLSQRHQK